MNGAFIDKPYTRPSRPLSIFWPSFFQSVACHFPSQKYDFAGFPSDRKASFGLYLPCVCCQGKRGKLPWKKGRSQFVILNWGAGFCSYAAFWFDWLVWVALVNRFLMGYQGHRKSYLNRYSFNFMKRLSFLPAASNVISSSNKNSTNR